MAVTRPAPRSAARQQAPARPASQLPVRGARGAALLAPDRSSPPSRKRDSAKSPCRSGWLSFVQRADEPAAVSTARRSEEASCLTSTAMSSRADCGVDTGTTTGVKEPGGAALTPLTVPMSPDDEVEAMTLGRPVCVLRDGRLQQADTPQAPFETPLNLFVGGGMADAASD